MRQPGGDRWYHVYQDDDGEWIAKWLDDKQKFEEISDESDQETQDSINRIFTKMVKKYRKTRSLDTEMYSPVVIYRIDTPNDDIPVEMHFVTFDSAYTRQELLKWFAEATNQQLYGLLARQLPVGVNYDGHTVHSILSTQA